MIRALFVALLYLFAAGCSGNTGDDSSALDVGGAAGAPSKPAMTCPAFQTQLPAVCTAPGEICLFTTNGNRVSCRCTETGAESCSYS